MLAAQGFLEVNGMRLEYRFSGPQPDISPTIVLLHEGLGCAAMWGDFPERLVAATGAGVFAYSRSGYGGSSEAELPRPLTYMHEEALNVLKPLLDAAGIRTCILVGHSDGASIAAIYAGAVEDPRVRGVILMAPHFFVEDISITSIEAAKVAYDKSDLRSKLARWHSNVDCAFRGWNDAWLDPEFRAWDITGYLSQIRLPLLLIQGEDDQYGTLRQIETARALAGGRVETCILPGVKHAPHREGGVVTLDAISSFVRDVGLSLARNGNA